jgi:hypothetical protein
MKGWKKSVETWKGVRMLRARRTHKRLARKQERRQGKRECTF